MCVDGELLEIERRRRRAAQVRKSYAKNPERAKRTAAEWCKANPERAKAHRKTSYRRKMEKQGYSERIVMFRKGLKKCASCLQVLDRESFSPNGKAGVRRSASCKECRRSRGLEGMRKVLHNRIRSSIRSCLKGSRKSAKTEELLGYSMSDLKQRLESLFTGGMDWSNMDKWHVDHIRPLCSFDISSDRCEAFKQAWALENLQPLWASDNLSKGGKWDGKV